jgi:aldose 1-epimerase
MSDRSVRLEGRDVAAIVDPDAGGRLTSLQVGGLELLVQQGKDVFHWGSFPMAPWVGRLRHGRLDAPGGPVRLPLNAPPHALHGLVTDLGWTVTAAEASSVELEVEFGGGPADAWPWRCRVTQRVALGERRIDFQLAVHAEVEMPADIGWHPWFLRDLPLGAGTVAAEWDIAGGQIYLNDDEGIPTGALGAPPPPPWDFCFVGLKRPPTVRWPGLLELTVSSDCEHWVLYDEEPEGLCVEPWTGPPNSLNGPESSRVTPAGPLEAAMSWNWRSLEPVLAGADGPPATAEQ